MNKENIRFFSIAERKIQYPAMSFVIRSPNWINENMGQISIKIIPLGLISVIRFSHRKTDKP